MKNYLAIITLLFGLSLSAQTFDRVFRYPDYPGVKIWTLQTIEYEAHYYFVTGVKGNSQFKGHFYKLNKDGDVVDSLPLSENYRLPVLYNDFIYLFNNEKSNNEKKDSISVKKINPINLSVQEKKEVLPQINWIYIQSSNYMSYCNCFTIVGMAVDSNGYRKSPVLQMDTNLTIIRENYYEILNGPILDSMYPDFPVGIVYEALENGKGDGLLLLGHPLDSVTNMQGFTSGVALLDSNLSRDSANQKLLRSDIKDQGGNSIYTWSISPEPTSGIRLTDTSYLFVGRATTDRYREDIQLWWLENDMGFVITDDSLNDVRWEFWGGVDSTEISPTGEGVSRHPDYNHAYIAYTSNFGFFAGMAYPYSLMKIDLEGNELWTKHYSIPWSYTVHSVLATSDGGALMTGTMIDTNTIEKDIWVVKVDSLGNLNVTGVNEVEGKIDVSNYIIYPNPAKNQLNLLKVNQFKPYEFELYDTFGRLVKTISWREDHQTVDVSSLASGMYVYRIIDQEGNVGSGKLMVE